MTEWTRLISVSIIDSTGKSALQDKKKTLGPIIMLNCIQPQGLNESDFFLARTGLLSLTASKTVRASNLLCSVCNFSNLCVVVILMVCGVCNGHSL